MKTQRYLTTQTDQKRGKTRVAKSRFSFALRLIGCEGSARPITERSKAEAKRSQLAFFSCNTHRSSINWCLPVSPGISCLVSLIFQQFCYVVTDTNDSLHPLRSKEAEA